MISDFHDLTTLWYLFFSVVKRKLNVNFVLCWDSCWVKLHLITDDREGHHVCMGEWRGEEILMCVSYSIHFSVSVYADYKGVNSFLKAAYFYNSTKISYSSLTYTQKLVIVSWCLEPSQPLWIISGLSDTQNNIHNRIPNCAIVDQMLATFFFFFFCKQPWCNPLWLTRLKAPTDWIVFKMHLEYITLYIISLFSVFCTLYTL